MKYKCELCGFVYDEDSEGAQFKDLATNWTCPLCGAEKTSFTEED